jgi:two-component system chemotaxis response regulator CheB
MKNLPYEAVIIGASAGAMEALMVLLPSLPKDYPLPIMIVVHLPPDKKSLMAELFNARCQMEVREAEDKEPIKNGTIYFAPPDYHLLVEHSKILSLSSEEPVYFSRPAIDVLFETAADAYGKKLIGIILTGGSSDGAKGLKTVINMGGTAIIQQPATAYASAMPEAAREASPEAQILTLEQIAVHLEKVTIL